MKKATAEQVELILKLYELRREAVMRQACSFVGGQFLPSSTEELVRIVRKGGQETGFVLQVFGCWDMVCAFVKHGVLSEGIVYDTCQEMYFRYAKIQPYLKQFRKVMRLPEWMENLEGVVEGSAKGRARIARMQESIQAVAESKT